jgi:hypothetical protein
MARQDGQCRLATRQHSLRQGTRSLRYKRMLRAEVSHTRRTERSCRRRHPILHAHRRPGDAVLSEDPVPHASPATTSAAGLFGRANCRRRSQSVLIRRLKVGPWKGGYVRKDGPPTPVGFQTWSNQQPWRSPYPRNAGWVLCSLFVLLMDGVSSVTDHQLLGGQQERKPRLQRTPSCSGVTADVVSRRMADLPKTRAALGAFLS